MNISIRFYLPLLGILGFSPPIHAERVTYETDTLFLSYDSEDQFNMGNPQLASNRFWFQPNLGVSVDSQTFDFTLPPPITDLQSFSVNFTVQAKPGYRIDNQQVSVTGFLYQSGRSTAAIGLSGPFNLTYNPATIGTSVSGIGRSATPLPNFSLSGDVSISAESYYAYDAPGGLWQEPIYGDIVTDDIIGYDDAVYDELGNFVSGTPIYRVENCIIGYNQIETFYPVYRIDAASAGLGEIVVDFQVSTVPLPTAGWLFLGGFGMHRLVTHRKGKLSA